MAARESGLMGLRLTLGGAPAEAHVVQGVPGLYRPDLATPVGGEGELPLDEAKRLDADPGVPLELVKIPRGDEEAVRRRVAADLEAARQGVAAAAQAAPEGSEPERIREEAQAVSATQAEPASVGSEQEG